MKCVAERKCQARLDSGKIKTFNRGAVENFAECPNNFRPLEGDEAMPIDFNKASEEELLEADYDLDKLRLFIMEKYDRKPGNRGKEKLVDMLMDCRYREVSDADMEGIL